MLDCPTCGQRILVRLGVRFSPKLADIFDAINRAGTRGGISAEVLGWMFYPNSTKPGRRNALSVSINHINDLLVETNYKIAMDARGGCYRLILMEGCDGD